LANKKGVYMNLLFWQTIFITSLLIASIVASKVIVNFSRLKAGA